MLPVLVLRDGDNGGSRMNEPHPIWLKTERPEDSNVVLAHLLHKHAVNTPDKTFCNFEDGSRWSYQDALAFTQETAHVLKTLGIMQGDLVLVWLPNSEAMLRCWFALNYLGAVFVPINLDYRGNLLQHVITESESRHIIVHPQLLERLRPLNTNGLNIVVVGEANDSEPPLEHLVETDLRSKCSVKEPANVHLWDTQMVIFTSGTTGPSKGVLCPYLHIHTMGQGCYGYMTEEDCMQVDLPMFHVGGVSPVIATLTAGATMVLFNGFSTSAFWDRISKYRVTTIAGLIGSMAAFLANSPKRENERNHTLRMVTLILTPQAIEVAERFGFDYCSGFNMSELATPLLAELNAKVPGSCGKPRTGVECRVVDEHDYECARNTVGELVVRTDQPWEVSSGYLNRPGATANAWRNGWFHTGDLVRQDEAGNFFFVDRLKDAIRRRGENISSLEIEGEVITHPGVADAAAVGIPSELGDEEVFLAVVSKANVRLTEVELMEYLIPRIPHFMVPRYIQFFDALPRTPTNKVQKYVLKKEGVGPNTWDRERHGYVLKKTRLS